jgi:hypothetical protein
MKPVVSVPRLAQTYTYFQNEMPARAVELHKSIKAWTTISERAEVAAHACVCAASVVSYGAACAPDHHAILSFVGGSCGVLSTNLFVFSAYSKRQAAERSDALDTLVEKLDLDFANSYRDLLEPDSDQ